MDAGKQRVKVAADRKKDEAKQAKETEEGTSSTPKTVIKVSKRKPNGKDNRPFKRAVVTLGDVSPKRKSPLSQAMVRAKE